MTLLEYAGGLIMAAGKKLRSGEIFAKVLTTNDDSGRHGVLIPGDAYSFFPDLSISDPLQNATGEFLAFDCLSKKPISLAYKYYQRYPERRITRLNGLINDRAHEPRLVVFLRAQHTDGTSGYYVDCANSAPGESFSRKFLLIFGNEVAPLSGTFITRQVDSAAFSVDTNLAELLSEFDQVCAKGWIDSLREGTTGIGYTFETLLGIKENNDKRADFKGIEIKCKGVKEGDAGTSGKINLFQNGPKWLRKGSAKDRIRVIGTEGDDGFFSCYSQVTTKINNIGLLLNIIEQDRKIDLLKQSDPLGYWTFDTLEKRLAEKHSRAVVVKASTRKSTTKNQFRYEELIYCEKPSIDRFVALAQNRNIVFEFLMSEQPSGKVRNHGYPWRLVREEFLDHLFSFQIKLR
jgi:MvaI/BcnI restriction endonuclease family